MSVRKYIIQFRRTYQPFARKEKVARERERERERVRERENSEEGAEEVGERQRE